MIILRSEKGEIYNLFTRSKHIIGRNGNLELEGDKSVSRQHAAIYVTVKDKKVQINLQDLGSKYGTFINDSSECIVKSTVKKLKIGDKIRFGLQWNSWIVEETQFVICASMLSPAQKKSLSNVLSPLNAILVSDWTDIVSHLTMNEIIITLKVVQALGRVKPIVSLEYWSVLADVLISTVEEPLPDCDDYIPPLVEPDLMNTPCDLGMNNSRRKLFQDIKFVATTTSQFNKISSMVTPAGGTVVDGTRTAFQSGDFEDGNVVVLNSDTINKRNRNLVELMNFLKTHKQRRIEESEIGMSLILNSRDTFCNPKRAPEFISRQTESQVMIKEENESSILDLETQEADDEESNTQFIDSDNSKFCLAVNDERVSSDNEADDVQVIHDTPEVVEPIIERPSAKRKRKDTSEQSSSKSLKMSDWEIKKPSTKPNIPVETSQVIENKKKPTSSLFTFNREKKPVGNSLNSLFKTSNPPTSSFDKTNPVEKRKRSSIELFSTESSSSTPPPKRANIEKKDLFQLPSTSKTTRTTRSGSLILFESDSVDSPLPKPPKLKTDQISNKENSHADVPKNINRSELVDLTRIKCKEEIKEESEDMSFVTKDAFNQSEILTIPLIKQESQRQSLNTSTGSAVNFKKFKKNNGINRTRVISTNELVVYTSNMNLNGDQQPGNYSDSESD